MRLRDDVFEHLLGALAGVVVRHPWKVVLTYGSLVLLSGLVTARWLEFHTDQNDLVSNDLEYNRRFLGFRKEFGDLEYIWVVIQVRDLGTAMRIADEVAAETAALTEHVRQVFHRVDVERLRRSGLIFVPREFLEGAARLVEEHPERARALLGVRGLADLMEFIPEHLDAATAREHPEAAELGVMALGEFLAGVDRILAGEEIGVPTLEDVCTSLRGDPEGPPGSSRTPMIDTELLDRFCSQGYLYTGGLLLVQILPVKNFHELEVIREPLTEIRAALDRVRQKYPGEVLGLTGRPVLQADEMETTSQDMMQAAILAALGVILLFMIFFREIQRPALAAAGLVTAIGLTFGVVSVVVGHLNLLSIVFAVMLVSMGMEFGVHLITRYQEELAATASVEASIRNALLTAGKGNVTGATTTAAAFYTTLFVDFQGLSELGFIAGTGVLLCMITMNSLLPALLILTERHKAVQTLAPRQLGFLNVLTSRPYWTLPVCGLLLIVGLPFLRGLYFDSNLLALQATSLKSVEFEKLVMERSDTKTWFAAITSESIDDVRRLTRELSAEKYAGVIGKVESIFDYVPDDQKEKIELIHRIASGLGIGTNGGNLPFAPPSSGSLKAVDMGRLQRALESLLERLDSFQSGTLRQEGEGALLLEELTNTLDGILEKIEEEPRRAAVRLGEFQATWFAALQTSIQEFLPLLDPVELDLSDIDPFLRKRVVSEFDNYLVHVFPREDIWQGDQMEEFIRALREVDENATGVPVQVYESTSLMKRGFLLTALYSAIAVFLLIWLDFHSPLFTVLAMIPVVLGLAWTLELMPILGMPFNLANFFSIPILIGGGINGGVHIIHRFREDRSAHVATRSTGTAVVLSFLNTLVGFGMLLRAEHQGLASLGAMMVLGSATCLVASVVVLPAVLQLVQRRRWDVERESS